MNPRKAIQDALKAVDVDPKSVRFYTSTEWKKRGEPYCQGSKGVLVFEESSLYTMLNYGCDIGWTFEEKFRKALEKHGLYYELGTSWYLGLYPTS